MQLTNNQAILKDGEYLLINEQTELDIVVAQLRNSDILFLDTEFVRDRAYFSKLCLLQIASRTSDIYAIDMLAGLDYAPLMQLINDAGRLKIFHAARQDVEILWQINCKLPLPFYDTQVASMFLGLGEQAGYATLVEHFLGLKLCKAQQFTDWERRPLSEAQLIYALDDVRHLREVYYLIQNKINELGRENWVAEEMQNIQTIAWFEADLDELWKRIKRRSDNPHYLARLQGLCAWREVLAKQHNLSRGRIMIDEVVQEIAWQNPTTLDDFKKIKGLSKRYFDLEKMLELLKVASALPLIDCPAIKIYDRLNPAQELLKDALKLLLKIVANSEKISGNLLCDGDDLQRIARGDAAGDILQGWRYDLFGRVVEDFMGGKVKIIMDKQLKIT
jgi:ribonuclease D